MRSRKIVWYTSIYATNRIHYFWTYLFYVACVRASFSFYFLSACFFTLSLTLLSVWTFEHELKLSALFFNCFGTECVVLTYSIKNNHSTRVNHRDFILFCFFCVSVSVGLFIQTWISLFLYSSQNSDIFIGKLGINSHNELENKKKA